MLDVALVTASCLSCLLLILAAIVVPTAAALGAADVANVHAYLKMKYAL